MEIKLSIIVVAMNHLRCLNKMLQSLFITASPTYTFEVILIDNCSKDGTIEFVKKYYPKVRIIQNEKIRGFAENNNIGYKYSKGNYIFISNPDIIFTDGSIDELINYFDKNQSIGILCPKLLNPDKTFQPSIRKFHTIKFLLKRLLTLGNDLSNNRSVNEYLLNDLDRRHIQTVDWALGAALLLKRSTYDKLQGFDECYFLYVEDEDLCLRCWVNGEPVVYFPKCFLIHEHQRASKSKITKKTFYHIRSLIYFFYKHGLRNKTYREKFTEEGFSEFWHLESKQTLLQ
jgi:GT2 family glycosyltransferase